MNVLQIYNQLQQKFSYTNIVEKEDIIDTVGEENFQLLVRNFMIVYHHKDDDGTRWYEL